MCTHKSYKDLDKSYKLIPLISFFTILVLEDVPKPYKDLDKNIVFRHFAMFQ